jgi:exopolyphosphatase
LIQSAVLPLTHIPDLDSIASSVAYAFLSSTLDAERTVPLVLTPKKLMSLRPENLLALQRANIPLSALLHPEDLPAGTEALTPAGVRFALVDHNHLLPAFAADPESVAAIIDHHEDEGVSPHANPRLIRTPLGSCASLVTKHFMPLWKASLSGPAGQAGSPVPPELATLLLSAILIDTSGLKKGGKAVDIDYAAAEFLYPISTLVNSTTSLVAPTTPEAIAAVPELEAYASTLSEIKHNVTGMSTPNLLQRDYKQYEWATASSAFPTLHVGLSTVPLSLRNQLEAEPTGWESYLAHVDAFMHERGIDIEGVLTSYRSEKKNKGRREFLLLVRSDSALPPDAAARALAALSAGLEAEVETFKYSPWGTGKSGSKGDLAAAAPKFLATPNRIGAVWDQGNAQSTRKQVAPVLVSRLLNAKGAL